MVLNVTYDLHQPGRDYGDLITAIKQYPWCHLAESTWLISTTDTADEIYEILRAKMDANDNVLVMRATPPYQGWLTQERWDWIHEYVN